MKRKYYPTIDDELVWLKAWAVNKGMLKLATYGTKEELLIVHKYS